MSVSVESLNELNTLLNLGPFAGLHGKLGQPNYFPYKPHEHWHEDYCRTARTEHARDLEGTRASKAYRKGSLHRLLSNIKLSLVC